MRLKHSVTIHGIQPELVMALSIAAHTFNDYDEKLAVTSILDGEHMRASLHYVGAAADLRRPEKHAQVITNDLADRLGHEFDVVLEHDHIHIEFQPKHPQGHHAG